MIALPMTTSSLPSFARGLTDERFDVLLDLSSWMRSWSYSLEHTHHCDESYLDIQEDGDELRQACEEAGFTWEQVETFCFDLPE